MLDPWILIFQLFPEEFCTDILFLPLSNDFIISDKWNVNDRVSRRYSITTYISRFSFFFYFFYLFFQVECKQYSMQSTPYCLNVFCNSR